MFYLVVSVFFRYFSHGACLFSLVLFQPCSARLLGYFYNDTLCNVNYCRRNELEEVFQDTVFLQASPHFSLSLLFRCIYYPPSLSFSFPLVNGVGVSKGSSLILGTDTSRISAFSCTFTKLILLRDSFAYAPFAPC